MTKQDILSQSMYLWQNRKDGDNTALFMKSRASWSLFWEGMPEGASGKPLFALLDEYNRPVIALYAVPGSPDYTLTYLAAPDRKLLSLSAPITPAPRHEMLFMCEPCRARLMFDGAFTCEVYTPGIVAADLFSLDILAESGTETVALWDYAFIEKEYNILCGINKLQQCEA